MLNYYFKDTIASFLGKSSNEIIGTITISNQFDSNYSQNKSWEQQIPILKKALEGQEGTIFFEFSIPRMGKRVDALILINDILFVVEFKVGETNYQNYQIEQVWDYALDLKNFHKPSHKLVLVPILVSTEATNSFLQITTTSHDDNLLLPIKTNKKELVNAIKNVLRFFSSSVEQNPDDFAKGIYSPTPTIVEAAVSLYKNHSVDDITRNDAEAKNLTETTNVISEIIDSAKAKRKKVICFVTGVPGAGKTLVGLKIATDHLDKQEDNTSVYLSGNAPLVSILQEALTRDKVARSSLSNKKITKREARQAVKSFIQIIHHYRDAYITDPSAPYDHVAIFDEAQRAWDKEQTVKFMKQKKGLDNFDFSEPEFLISCLDRHKDWAVIVCLVGGGQEINIGEAGISAWLDAISKKFNQWEVCISKNLTDSEYAASDSIANIGKKSVINYMDELHLGVSKRSFRAESVSMFVKHLLDIDLENTKKMLSDFISKYPIVVTRDLSKAKSWLKEKARGSERYGIVVSSQAQRLKPFAIDVRIAIDPVHWFLDDKDDIRSSYFLEDVATEFQVQGLELDWACVVWDGDLRFSNEGWKTFSFKGSKWQNIHKDERKKYLINAYRVLLTRARQGMIIVIPEGSSEDLTRKSEFYDPTFEYLKSIGIKCI